MKETGKFYLGYRFEDIHKTSLLLMVYIPGVGDCVLAQARCNNDIAYCREHEVELLDSILGSIRTETLKNAYCIMG